MINCILCNDRFVHYQMYASAVVRSSPDDINNYQNMLSEEGPRPDTHHVSVQACAGCLGVFKNSNRRNPRAMSSAYLSEATFSPELDSFRLSYFISDESVSTTTWRPETLRVSNNKLNYAAEELTRLLQDTNHNPALKEHAGEILKSMGAMMGFNVRENTKRVVLFKPDASLLKMDEYHFSLIGSASLISDRLWRVDDDSTFTADTIDLTEDGNDWGVYDYDLGTNKVNPTNYLQEFLNEIGELGLTVRDIGVVSRFASKLGHDRSSGCHCHTGTSTSFFLFAQGTMEFCHECGVISSF